MKQILERYEVTEKPEDEIPSSNVFDWELTMMDPFTIELHETARRVMGKKIKMNFRRILETLVLLLVALS
jgi:hypothetical protein